jgi:hypothetical protein
VLGRKLLYQAARNKVTIEMRKSKSNYFQQKIKDCEKIDPKATWKLINYLVGKSHKSNHVTEIELEGKNTVDGSDISEAFNDYFINIGPKLAAESTSNSSNNVHKYLRTDKLNYPCFSFENVLVDNVLLTLNKLQKAQVWIIFLPKC